MLLTKRLKYQTIFLILTVVVFLNTTFISPAPNSTVFSLEEAELDTLITTITQNPHFLTLIEGSSLLIGKVIANYQTNFVQNHEPSNRLLIRHIISIDPGITLREIKRETGLAMGVIQYHLNILENKDVESLRLGRTKHFFLKISEFTAEEKVVLALQRNPTIRAILDKLYQGSGFITQKELVLETGKSRALISYYIKSLKFYGIVETIPRQVKLSHTFTLQEDLRDLL